MNFFYELTGQSILAAPFSAVNESTWEHMKILLFPMFVFSFIEYRYIGKNHRDFWCVKLAGTLTDKRGTSRDVYVTVYDFGDISELAQDKQDQLYALQEVVNVVVENLK